MLLAFRRVEACPAEVLVALCALDMGTATLNLGNPHSAFRVWAPLRTLFHVDVIEFGFN